MSEYLLIENAVAGRSVAVFPDSVPFDVAALNEPVAVALHCVNRSGARPPEKVVAMFAMSLVLPQLLRLPTQTGYGLGRPMLTVGLVMAPQGLVMMAMAPVSAMITKSRGPKTTLMLGALIVAAGYGLNIVLMSEVWQLILVSCAIGAGVGFAYGAMPALIMGAVPPSETAAANSLNTLMRSIGTSVASAVAGVILAQLTISPGGHALPSENGFKVVMAIGAGAAVLAFVLASFLPRPRPATAAPAPAPAESSAETVG